MGATSATGADGTVYTLTIPEDALATPTDMSLTPVASVSGLPTSGDVTYAVQLSPSGLQLDDFASPDDHTTSTLPIDQQVPFGYEGEGEGMFLAIPVVSDPRIQLRILHFSGYGVTRGLLSEIAPVRQRLGGEAEISPRKPARGSPPTPRRTSVARRPRRPLRSYWMRSSGTSSPKSSNSASQRCGNTCANGRLALESVLRLHRWQEMLQGATTTFPADVLTTAFHVCTQEEYELCKEAHVVHRIIPVVLGFEHQRQGLRGSRTRPSKTSRQALATRCLKFELDLTSKANVVQGPVKVRSDVESTVKLTLDPGSILTGTPHITGSSALKNTKFAYSIGGDPHGCSFQNHRGGSTLIVTDLTGTAETGDLEQQLGVLTDLALTFDPGTTTEHADLKCTGAPAQTLPGPWWSAAFLGLHAGEKNDQGTYTTTGWVVKPEELLGSKEWQPVSGTLREEGSFELHHRPE